MKTPNSKTEKHVLASKKHHDHSFLSGSKFNDNSDLPKRLRDMGLSDEDKEKLFALKYYIYKSSQSSIRLSTFFTIAPNHLSTRIMYRIFMLRFNSFYLASIVEKYCTTHCFSFFPLCVSSTRILIIKKSSFVK